jgi:hypothetical protein
MPPKGTKKTPVVTLSQQTAQSDDEEGEDEGPLMAMMKSMAAQLSGLTVKMEKIDNIESEMKGLKVLLTDLKNENKQLKTEARVTERKLNDMNERNNSLENRVNNLEQYHRSWSARAMNIPLSEEEERDNQKVADKVYNILLLPILRGAVERKLISTVPPIEQLLELAHVLPGKAGQPKPVIMRFLNRNVKEVVFKMKKFYAPREESRSGGGASQGASGGEPAGSGGGVGEGGGFEGRGKYLFPLYEDLTRGTFQKMRAIANDSRVKSCWSVKGQIKFVLHRNLNEVKRVNSLLDPHDDILK